MRDAEIGEKKAFYINHLGRKTGGGVSRNAPYLSPRYGARVVLIKTGNGEYKILNSYPI